MEQVIIKSLTDLTRAAKEFIELTKDYSIFTFVGTMGVGKTTFIKEFCLQKGVKDEVTSPTFAIINEYKSANNSSIFHFDLYRLETLEDAINIGVEEYLYGEDICLIEWPEIIDSLLPENTLHVSIKENEKGERIISF